MKIAIISDLHSNEEALKEVLKDIKVNEKPDLIYCLGDLIGYGPDPLYVTEYSLEWDLTIMGNHDQGVTFGAYGFNPIAKSAIDWTTDQLQPGFLSSSKKKQIWKFLTELPLAYKFEDILFVHGSPRDATMEYILRNDGKDFFGTVSSKLVDIFSRFERLCFVGHTHDPGIFKEDGVFYTPADLNYEFDTKGQGKVVINVGSVGQPRDGDSRACYAVYTDGNIRWKRISYNLDVTMKKIYKVPELDRRLADRLKIGK